MVRERVARSCMLRHLMALSPGWVKTEMGGAAATLTVQDSVAQMRRTLSRLDASHRGAFINQEGQTLPW